MRTNCRSAIERLHSEKPARDMSENQEVLPSLYHPVASETNYKKLSSPTTRNSLLARADLAELAHLCASFSDNESDDEDVVSSSPPSTSFDHRKAGRKKTRRPTGWGIEAGECKYTYDSPFSTNNQHASIVEYTTKRLVLEMMPSSDAFKQAHARSRPSFVAGERSTIKASNVSLGSVASSPCNLLQTSASPGTAPLVRRSQVLSRCDTLAQLKIKSKERRSIVGPKHVSTYTF